MRGGWWGWWAKWVKGSKGTYRLPGIKQISDREVMYRMATIVNNTVLHI